MLSLPIEKLYLGGDSDIIKVPDDITCLQELYIRNLDKIIDPISKMLPNLSSLDTLSVNYGMETEDSDEARIIAAFVANSQLLKLELLHCKTVISIINAVSQSSVQTLNLRNVSFRNEEAVALANILVNHSAPLIKLSLITCNFQRTALILIADAIKKSKLKVLILDSSYFENDADMIIADCITNSCLTKLSLLHTVFVNNGRDVMFEAIKHSSLKTLNVQSCSILNNFNIINYLISHQGLTKFKFSECAFDAEERLAFLDAIRENCSLKHISFYSSLARDGAILIDQLVTKICALLKDPRFKSFDLDYRSLPDTALKRIMDSIKESSIMSLKFEEYYPKDEHTTIVRDLLENYRFEKLKLHFVSFTNECIEQMLPSIQQSSITKFNVRGNFAYMSDELQNAIELILRSTRQRARGRHTKSARS